MFSEKDLLIDRNVEDMKHEVEELLAESNRLQREHEIATQKEFELRKRSIEVRPENAELAEAIWQEAELLKDESREMLRLSMEKKLHAAEVKHRIDIHCQIESLDNYDEVWRESARMGRK